MPSQAYAAWCDSHYRYGPPPAGALADVLTFLWSVPGGIVTLFLALAGIGVLLSGWFCSDRVRTRAGTYAVSGAFTLHVIRLIVGAAFSCEEAVVARILEVTMDAVLGIAVGCLVLVIPCLVLGAGVVTLPRMLLPARVPGGSSSAKSVSPGVRSLLLIAGCLSISAIAWNVLAAAMGCCVTGVAIALAVDFTKAESFALASRAEAWQLFVSALGVSLLLAVLSVQIA